MVGGTWLRPALFLLPLTWLSPSSVGGSFPSEIGSVSLCLQPRLTLALVTLKLATLGQSHGDPSIDDDVEEHGDSVEGEEVAEEHHLERAIPPSIEPVPPCMSSWTCPF